MEQHRRTHGEDLDLAEKCKNQVEIVDGAGMVVAATGMLVAILDAAVVVVLGCTETVAVEAVGQSETLDLATEMVDVAVLEPSET